MQLLILKHAVKQSSNTQASNLKYIEVSERKLKRARKHCCLQTDFIKFVKTRCHLKAFPHLYFLLHISCYFSLVSCYFSTILLLEALILVILQAKPMC